MRVNHVAKSNKDQGKCGKCRVELPAGSAYRWVKGRYSSRKVRCTKSECGFRNSDLTESKMSAVYAAQEALSDALSGWDGQELSEISDECVTAAEAIREVAQEYADAAEAMQGAGESMQEKSDSLEQWASEIEDAGNEPDEFVAEPAETLDCPVCSDGEEPVSETAKHEGGNKYECGACGLEFENLVELTNGNGETREEWADAVRSTVQDALDNCPD
jgi:transcription elongation factor Elf1